MERQSNSNNVEKETVRIEAFSDGVFAIAITLLILEIHVPRVTPNETLLHSLLHEWKSFLAFLIGFFTLLVCWINHHYMFRMIQQSNSVLLLLNGFKLLVVTITPFATALLASSIQSPWQQGAINVYGFSFALMGSAMTGIWLYAKGQGFIHAGSDSKLKAATRLYIFASLFSMLIWVVSFISIIGCLILFGMMFGIFVFPERMVSWQLRRASSRKVKHANIKVPAT